MRTQKQIAATNKQQRDAFIRGAKQNGASGMETFVRELHFWNAFGDWRGMAELINGVVSGDSEQFRKMVGECLDASWTFKSGKFVRNKNHKFDAADSAGNHRGLFEDQIAKFAELAERGASFRGYKKAKAEDNRTDDEKNEAKRAKLAADTLRHLQKSEMSIDEWANFLRLAKVAQDAEGNAAAA